MRGGEKKLASTALESEFHTCRWNGLLLGARPAVGSRPRTGPKSGVVA